jgi:hypothetical protein
MAMIADFESPTDGPDPLMFYGFMRIASSPNVASKGTELRDEGVELPGESTPIKSMPRAIYGLANACWAAANQELVNAVRTSAIVVYGRVRNTKSSIELINRLYCLQIVFREDFDSQPLRFFCVTDNIGTTNRGEIGQVTNGNSEDWSA